MVVYTQCSGMPAALLFTSSLETRYHQTFPPELLSRRIGELPRQDGPPLVATHSSSSMIIRRSLTPHYVETGHQALGLLQGRLVKHRAARKERTILPVKLLFLPVVPPSTKLTGRSSLSRSINRRHKQERPPNVFLYSTLLECLKHRSIILYTYNDYLLRITCEVLCAAFVSS